MIELLSKRTIFLFMTALLMALHFVAFSKTGVLLDQSGNSLYVQDFSYNALISSDFWDGRIESPWTFTGQQAALAHHRKGTWPQVMPVGVTPAGVILLQSFVWLGDDNLLMAYRFYLMVSFVGILIGCIFFIKGIPNNHSQWLCITLAAGLSSLAGMQAITLGQTSLLALAGLLGASALALSSRPQSLTTAIGTAIVILPVSSKPLYILLAAILLTCCRRWRDLSAATITLLLLVGLFALHGGYSALMTYPQALQQYSKSLPSYYTYGRPFYQIPTLAGYLSRFYPEAIAIQVSVLASISVLSLGVGMAFLKRFKNQPAIPLSLVLLAGIVLSPYSGEYEALLLILPIMLRWHSSKSISLPEGSLFAFLGLLLWFPLTQGTELLVKTILLGMVILLEGTLSPSLPLSWRLTHPPHEIKPRTHRIS